MKALTVEKFTLQTIANAAKGTDIEAVRSLLSFASGAVLDVAGKVRKVVKRDNQLKLVIEPGDVCGFVVFADCRTDAEKVKARKIRKGSLVSVRGKFQTFGASAVCLSDCRLRSKTAR